MSVANRIGLLALLGTCVPAIARAEHHHDGSHAHGASVGSSFAAGVGLVAARFDTMTYIGDYQGVLPSRAVGARAVRRRRRTSALYRLLENGRRLYGVGDLALSGQAVLLGRGAGHLGVALPVSLPTGDHVTGFGMGHVMMMPTVWANWSTPRIVLGAAAGYGRALGGDTHHDHGAWPLVEPMNMQEVTWGVNADVPLGRVIRVGVRASGGVAIGTGHDRVVGGVRAAWVEGPGRDRGGAPGRHRRRSLHRPWSRRDRGSLLGVIMQSQLPGPGVRRRLRERRSDPDGHGVSRSRSAGSDLRQLRHAVHGDVLHHVPREHAAAQPAQRRAALSRLRLARSGSCACPITSTSRRARGPTRRTRSCRRASVPRRRARRSACRARSRRRRSASSSRSGSRASAIARTTSSYSSRLMM